MARYAIMLKYPARVLKRLEAISSFIDIPRDEQETPPVAAKPF